MFTVGDILTIGGALITAVAGASVALARIKTLEKKVETNEKEIEALKTLQSDDKEILVRLETKMDMLLNGNWVPHGGIK